MGCSCGISMMHACLSCGRICVSCADPPEVLALLLLQTRPLISLLQSGPELALVGTLVVPVHRLCCMTKPQLELRSNNARPCWCGGTELHQPPWEAWRLFLRV